MPTITIDGKQIEFDGKKTILEVAKENESQIPHYCYHEGLSVVASCRICLAEVAQPNPRNDNKVELIPKLLPTCQTPAVDGAMVYTKSPKAIANQKSVMEYLLINHPLDCPVCDQAGECSLQDYSYKYGRGESRFEEEKSKNPKKDIGSNTYLYSDRCIMCTRCVRFTREVTGTGELSVQGRGHREQIDVFPGRGVENEMSGNLVDICPVGALLDKDFLFEQRVWFLKTSASIDGVTCSGDNINIEQNEEKVYRFKPRTNLEVNKWWISDEIRYGWKHVHREDRLSGPKKKQYTEQVDLDWHTAYEAAKHGLEGVVKQDGMGSLGLMVSPMLSCEEAFLLGKVVKHLDPKATLAVGPVPIDGEDKTFPGGYTIYAEKCPNARGVRRALEMVDPDSVVLDFEAFQAKIRDKESDVKGLVLTGNYASNWATTDFIKAVGKKFFVLIDTLPSDLMGKAGVILPSATWMEKAGTFENVNNRLQSFGPALKVIEGAKAEGQIALDLMGYVHSIDADQFNAARIRGVMGGVFDTDVHEPAVEIKGCGETQQFVEL